jgi:hypothetical protein
MHDCPGMFEHIVGRSYTPIVVSDANPLPVFKFPSIAGCDPPEFPSYSLHQCCHRKNAFNMSWYLSQAYFAREMNMTSPIPGEHLPQAGRIAPMPRVLVTASVGCLSESGLEGARDDWHIQLQNLQRLICELLVKNQQLRMKLMEMKAREPALRNSCHG